MKGLAVVGLASIALAPLGVQAAGQVVVTCPRTSVPPILDGNVMVDEWIAAGRMSPFVLLHNQGLPREASDVRVMYDGQALYVGAILYDSDTDNLRATVTETDGDVYRDDCFELFIDAIGDGKSYHHLVINAIGTRFDEVDNDRGQSSVWNAGVAIREKEWSVEIAIPFGNGRTPPDGSSWRIGAARHQARLGEYSSWNGFVESFHEPQRFGILYFSPPCPVFSLVDVGSMRLGRNTALLFADNATATPRTLKANVRVQGRDHSGHFFVSTKFTAAAGARTTVDIPYEIKQDGDGSLVFSVTDEHGRPVYRTAPLPLNIPMVAGELFAAEAALAEAGRAWARVPESEGKERLALDLEALLEEWRELTALARERKSLSVAELREVQTAIADLRQRAERLRLRLQAVVIAGGELRPFAIIPVNSLTKVFPDEQPALGSDEAHVEACRNEWEAFQLAIVPFSDRPLALSLRAEPLRAPTGSIGAECVQLRVVGNVPATDHLRSGAPKRLWPDVLTPAIGDSEGITVRPDQTCAIWVSVHLPADALPGEYIGAVCVQDDGGCEVRVPVRVVVHRPVLPSPGDFQASLGFWQAPRRIAEQYGLEPWSPEHWDLLRTYLSDLAAHGQKLATVTRDMFEWRTDEGGSWQFVYTIFDRYVELCREVGIDEGIEYYSMFNGAGDTILTWADATGTTHRETTNPGDERFDSLFSAFLRDLAQHLDEKGWLQNVFVCPTDEPRDSPGVPTLQRFARCAELVRTAHPALKTTVALDSPVSARALAPHIDRMVFKLSDDVYDRDLARAKQAEGGRVEAYICCHPQRPNTFITSPNIDSRVIGWLLFREELSGLLRWSYERWPPDPLGCPEGDGRYPAGDLFIVYPGPDGPYASPRWELLRDGLEDHELLCLLREAAQKARSAGQTEQAEAAEKTLAECVKRVVGAGPGLAEFTDDPRELELARLKVLTTLDWLWKE